MTVRLALAGLLVLALAACGGVRVDAAGSGSEVEHWSVGLRF
jgi:ABC-type glycerol-3-phosphate transport system substrate-binding protein